MVLGPSVRIVQKSYDEANQDADPLLFICICHICFYRLEFVFTRTTAQVAFWVLKHEEYIVLGLNDFTFF